MNSAAFQQQLEKIQTSTGFLAALDQSGGSTPKALRLYGVSEDQFSNDEEMFSIVHEMRTRIITSPFFDGDRVLGAILFENTLDRTIADIPSAHFLWREKKIVPFLKIDKGLEAEINDVQLMKAIPNLSTLLEKAKNQDVFGTKMRSVVKMANEKGIAAVVEQQFSIAKEVIAAGLVPIIEPEIDIHSPQKAEAEALLKQYILQHLNQLPDDQIVMLKLSIPSQANFYADCIDHPQVLKVVALSGGYSRVDANAKVAENKGMIASFSRALTEGLSAQQSDDEFNELLNQAIEGIYQASSAG